MKVTIKKLSVLKHPEKNVRIHSEQQIRELKRSLEKFGQTRALVIDENNIILIGNGLYEAMVSLGYQEATVYVKAGLSENDKKKLMIADNKTYALGIDNLETLNEFLEELQGDLDIPGYDEEILQQMVADADEVTEKLSEYGTLDDSEIQKIKEANEKREQKAAVDTQSADNGESSPEKPNPQNEQPAEEQTEVTEQLLFAGQGMRCRYGWGYRTCTVRLLQSVLGKTPLLSGCKKQHGQFTESEEYKIQTDNRSRQECKPEYAAVKAAGQFSMLCCCIK